MSKQTIKANDSFILRFMDKYQTALSILLFFLIWEFIVRAFCISEAFLCTPSSAIAHLLFKQPDADYHWRINITCTLYEFVLGFTFTAIGGVFISLVLAWSKTIQKIVMPLFVFLNSMPIVAITPLLIIWMGYGLHANILVAFLASFFPMVINTMAGLNSVANDLLDLVDYLNASKFQIFWKIRMPKALPYIFSGLKICSTLSVMGVIVGELIASDKGLGYVIANSQKTMDTPPMFASLIMMSLLGWAMYLVVCLLERVCMPWRFVQSENRKG